MCQISHGKPNGSVDCMDPPLDRARPPASTAEMPESISSKKGARRPQRATICGPPPEAGKMARPGQFPRSSLLFDQTPSACIHRSRLPYASATPLDSNAAAADR
ncbi:MAG: hypothetical protein MUF20_14660, partial [Methylotetracoccus sp.]|nr:hypothetical protein [Methylotetracoccus sp.]